MADITLSSGQCYLYEIGTAQKEIALDTERLWTIFHTGKDAAGAASTVDVFFQCDGNNAVASYASALGKLVIQEGFSFPVPPGVSSIKGLTASGSVALQFIGSEKFTQHRIG